MARGGGKRFDSDTIERVRGAVWTAVDGDRPSFDLWIDRIRSADAHERVADAIFVLFLLSTTLKVRRTRLIRGRLAVERLVTRPWRSRHSLAYRNYLIERTTERVDEIVDLVCAGTFGDVVEPAMLRSLVADEPLRAINDGSVDRHNPMFLTTAIVGTAAFMALATRGGQPDQVGSVVDALGRAARLRRFGATREALIRGVAA